MAQAESRQQQHPQPQPEGRVESNSIEEMRWLLDLIVEAKTVQETESLLKEHVPRTWLFQQCRCQELLRWKRSQLEGMILIQDLLCRGAQGVNFASEGTGTKESASPLG